MTVVVLVASLAAVAVLGGLSWYVGKSIVAFVRELRWRE